MADWLNNDLSDYVDDKEKILIDVRQNTKMCLISALGIALFASCFLVIFLTVFVSLAANKDPNFTVFILALGCVFICSYPLFAWLVYNSQLSKRYVLTNCRIYSITGFIFKHVKCIAYNQITDVHISRGPIQRIIGVGSVGVGTASGNVVGSVTNGNGLIYSDDELTMDSIDNYKQVKDIITKNRKK